LVANDSDVMLDGRAVGNAIEQSRDVGEIADGLQIPLLIEFFGQSNGVNGPRRFGQIHHARIDAPMRVKGKVFRFQVLGGFVIGVIVEQDGAEDSALSFDGLWQTAYVSLYGSH